MLIVTYERSFSHKNYVANIRKDKNVKGIMWKSVTDDDDEIECSRVEPYGKMPTSLDVIRGMMAELDKESAVDPQIQAEIQEQSESIIADLKQTQFFPSRNRREKIPEWGKDQSQGYTDKNRDIQQANQVYGGPSITDMERRYDELAILIRETTEATKKKIDESLGISAREVEMKFQRVELNAIREEIWRSIRRVFYVGADIALYKEAWRSILEGKTPDDGSNQEGKTVALWKRRRAEVVLEEVKRMKERLTEIGRSGKEIEIFTNERGNFLRGVKMGEEMQRTLGNRGWEDLMAYTPEGKTGVYIVTRALGSNGNRVTYKKKNPTAKEETRKRGNLAMKNKGVERGEKMEVERCREESCKGKKEALRKTKKY